MNLKTYLEKYVPEYDSEQALRDSLDECYSFESVGGPFTHMRPSQVLEEMDPVAFRCACADEEDAALRDGRATEYCGTVYPTNGYETAREEWMQDYLVEGPADYASAIVNGDFSGLTDEEAEACRDFIQENNIDGSLGCEELGYSKCYYYPANINES